MGAASVVAFAVAETFLGGSSNTKPAPRVQSSSERDMVMAATAAGYTGKLENIRNQMEVAREVAAQIVKTNGVNGPITDQKKAELMKKAASSVAFQAASKEADQGKGFMHGVRKASFLTGAGVGGAVGGLVVGTLATVLKVVTLGKSPMGIMKSAAWAAGIGAAIGALATSPLTWVAGKFSKSRDNNNKASQLAMQNMVATVIEHAEHGRQPSVAVAQAAQPASPQQAAAPEAPAKAKDAAVAAGVVAAGTAAAVAATSSTHAADLKVAPAKHTPDAPAADKKDIPARGVVARQGNLVTVEFRGRDSKSAGVQMGATTPVNDSAPPAVIAAAEKPAAPSYAPASPYKLAALTVNGMNIKLDGEAKMGSDLVSNVAKPQEINQAATRT